MHLFIERVHDLAQIKGAPTVRLNLSSCLRGTAIAWYTEELSSLERTGLWNDTNRVQAWCSALEARFREPISLAFERLSKEKYTVTDARNRRKPSAYVQAIIRHSEASGFTTQHE